MSLERVLLTLLEEPAAGYDLKREFEAGAQTFWPALPSQIYSTLHRLEDKGFLESSHEASDLGPDRRVYRRTDLGRQEMETWIRSGPEVGRERFAYLGQLAAIGLLDEPDVGRDFLVQLRRWFQEKLSHLRPIEAQLLGDETPETVSDAAFYDWAALTMGTSVLEARVAACTELLWLLEQRSEAAQTIQTKAK